MRPILLLALPALLLAGHACAEEWTTIDFDADLRTMLIDTDSVTHNGTHASLTELEVEGRTAQTRGDQFHVLVSRDFDCNTGAATVTKVQTFANLASPGTNLPVPPVTYTPRAGSIDSTEFAIACKGAVPQSPYFYPSVAEAVNNAFANAVKLPAAQNNRTTRGIAMGPPPGGK